MRSKPDYFNTATALIIVLLLPAWALYTANNSPPKTAFIIGEGTHFGLGLRSSDLFNPEKALSRGIPGHVNVEYAEKVPRIVIVSPGKEVRLRVAFTLVSHTGNFSETVVVLDPDNGSGYGFNNVSLNDHVSYEPSIFLLKLGEAVEVNMTYLVPEGLSGFSLHREELLGVGVRAEVPVKAGYGGSYHPEDLSWAYAALGSPLGKPAWLMVNRFRATSHPETIFDIESIDFDKYPKLLEAFRVEERYPQYPHPYEWVNCTHKEGVEIVGLLGGRYVASDEAYDDYYFDIRYGDISYSVTVIFAWELPVID